MAVCCESFHLMSAYYFHQVLAMTVFSWSISWEFSQKGEWRIKSGANEVQEVFVSLAHMCLEKHMNPAIFWEYLTYYNIKDHLV